VKYKIGDEIKINAGVAKKNTPDCDIAWFKMIQDKEQYKATIQSIYLQGAVYPYEIKICFFKGYTVEDALLKEEEIVLGKDQLELEF
jgi:hypothetical protein